MHIAFAAAVPVLQDVQRADAVVYGMGSLYTSICPTLILDGVGEAIAARTDIPKVGGRERDRLANSPTCMQ
jgi:2-phospho-L-lactate transferase/gluconeogenesis factor (CofD/UPF0052 family)